jgi:hypothetical protein
MRFNEEFRVIGFEPPRRHTPHRRFQIWQTFHGRVRGTFTWTLEAEGNQTYASIDAAYQLMGGVFGRALDALLVERAVQKDVDQMLENMKHQLALQTMFTQQIGGAYLTFRLTAAGETACDNATVVSVRGP